MTQIFDSLGWALLHSIWQGGLAMIAVIIFRSFSKNGSPSLRYNFQILCLFGCFAAFLVTFGLYQMSGGTLSALKTFSAVETASQAAALLMNAPDGLQVTSQSLSVSAAAYAPLLGVLWCLGFAFMATRYLAAYLLTQRLRRTGLNDVPVFWQNRFRILALNTGVTERVRLFISDHVSAPLTIGFIKPVVLVPASFLMGLPQDQVEAILLHELGHIRRYDYLVNLFQTAIKTVLFFHPAIHYISGKIDIDREQACDDLAVAQSKDPQALVLGLAALRLSMSGRGFALSADGGDTPLMDRLKRLVGSVEHQRRPEHLLMPLVATLLIGGIYVSTTTVANAHPKPSPYEHAKADKQNYTFETKRLNGRYVTVKTTEDGRRWVLADGAWTDVDKSPEVLSRLPIAMPQPPQPPAAPKYKNGKMDSYAFEAKMDQFEIDMEYFEADIERYFEENNQLSEHEQDRLEHLAERQMDRAERDMERIEDQIEREIERAEDQQERAMERAEQQRERAKERQKRAEKVKYKTDQKHEKYNEMRETLYSYLVADGFIASRSVKATMRYVDDNWTVNEQIIPSSQEGKYCKLFANTGVKKSTITKVEIQPGSTHIVNESGSGTNKHTHKVTIGKHVHKDGKEYNHQSAPSTGYPQVNPPTPNPQPNPQPRIQKMKHNVTASAPRFVWPTVSPDISAQYGQTGQLWEKTHHGIDLKGNTGAPILASADGIVQRVGRESKWGNRIVLQHSGEFQTLYAHMNSLNVTPGQYVKAGDVIGGLGSTGQSTGPHLHFEIRKDGQRVNPETFIN